MNKKILAGLGGLIVVILLTSPFFFDIDRIGAFNAVPHDDYADYVLALAHRGGSVPEAPYVYRIESVAMALPFYYALPTYKFSGLHNVDPGYLKATQALSVVSYLSLVLTSLVIFSIVRRRFKGSVASAAILALASFLLGGYTSTVGIDPLAILIVSLLVYWMDSPWVFAPLVLISTGFNEKIPFLFAALFLGRFVASAVRRDRFPWYAQLASSWLAVAVYFLVRLDLFRAGGYANQIEPTTYAKSLIASLAAAVSPEGLVTDLLPIGIVIVLAVLAVHCGPRGPFQTSDVAAAAVMLLIALAADLGLTVGRVVMYSYPLYLPASALLLDRALSAWQASGPAHDLDAALHRGRPGSGSGAA